MITVNNNQQLITYKELTDMKIEDHINILNTIPPETAFLYLWNCIANSELLELQKNLNKIKSEELRDEINTRTNEYIIRMKKIQNAHNNNKIQEYLENITYEELVLHTYDFKEENVELTEHGKLVAKEINKKIETIPSTLEPIEIEQKKRR
jgi:nucleoid DNA-binding protein